MRRKPFTLAAAGLAVLCVAAFVLGNRSYSTPTVVEFSWGGERWELVNSDKAWLDNEPQVQLEG